MGGVSGGEMRTCTAKSQMTTALRASSHQASNTSLLTPLCSPLGVAISTHGPTSSNAWPGWRCDTWRKANGSRSCAHEGRGGGRVRAGGSGGVGWGGIWNNLVISLLLWWVVLRV